MASSKQPAVAAAGFGLVLANYWLGGQRTQLSGKLFNPKSSKSDIQTVHNGFKEFFIELSFVLVATIIAGISEGAGSAMLALIVTLAIVWAIQHFASLDAG